MTQESPRNGLSLRCRTCARSAIRRIQVARYATAAAQRSSTTTWLRMPHRGRSELLPSALVALWLSSFAYIVHAAKKDCLIDKEKGWFDPSNVYQCVNSDCCTEYGKHSCCAKKPKSEIVQEQLLLWGGLLGFLLLLAVIIYCKRKDVQIFEGRSLRCKFCPGQRDRIENIRSNVA
ncbi:hypothetical protein HPB50_007792 [Hyalomma asiaticum]|uniref:Uncharacterized protein n=1 Tax=Hyalomma asiaticum TaxID=266040 RepID=A0ACB7TE14_HYAAI|nr:hypothetical protein HPB50_007792 [Hyalomma asiaticum]